MVFMKTRYVTCLSLIVAYFIVFASPVLGDEIVKRHFKPSRMVSAEISKNELKQIYMDGSHARTFHCGCLFDKLKQTSTKACLRKAPASLPIDTKQFMGWMRAMPSAVFGESLACWKKNSCARKSPRFKRMQSDMHNLFPSIATGSEKSALQKEFPFGGMDEYKFCKVDGKVYSSMPPSSL